MDKNPHEMIGSFAVTASLIISLVTLCSVTQIKGFDELLRNTSDNSVKLNTMVTELKAQNVLQHTPPEFLKNILKKR